MLNTHLKKEGRNFTSNFTGLNYEIRHTLTCKSRYCVYLITCRCGMQYTGKSINCMHVGHGGQRQEIENQSSELGKHFARCGYDNLSLQIIDCVREGEDLALIQLEGVWQNRLATFQVHGNRNIRDTIRGKVMLFFEDNVKGVNSQIYKKKCISEELRLDQDQDQNIS